MRGNGQILLDLAARRSIPSYSSFGTGSADKKHRFSKQEACRIHELQRTPYSKRPGPSQHELAKTHHCSLASPPKTPSSPPSHDKNPPHLPPPPPLPSNRIPHLRPLPPVLFAPKHPCPQPLLPIHPSTRQHHRLLIYRTLGTLGVGNAAGEFVEFGAADWADGGGGWWVFGGVGVGCGGGEGGIGGVRGVDGMASGSFEGGEAGAEGDVEGWCRGKGDQLVVGC